MILVAGGSGLIGGKCLDHYRSGTPGLFQLINYDILETPPFNWFDASRPLGTYDLSRVDAFIDCARYDHQCDQVATWETVVEHFKHQHGGRMILFSSIYGHKAPDFSIYPGTEIPTTPLKYAMDKAAVEQAVRYLAQQLKPWGIQVNAIAPGGVLNNHSEEFQQAYRESGGASMITTASILPVVDMLLDPVNAVNGQVITVDGGWGL
jgi:NAD(P)-dependent dehydrogenase (short-subunit alcohol dehydrogenase family)